MMNRLQQIERLKKLLKSQEFELPLNRPIDGHYPDFLQKNLEGYKSFIQDKIGNEIDEKVIFDQKDIILPKISSLICSINKAITCYYEGKVLKAITLFNESLTGVSYDYISLDSEIKKGINFYRGRKGKDDHFSAPDLFHIKFEDRHLVSSNRYSIPGFPALYLGDSIYVCWEEFNRYNLHQTWYSRFENTRATKVVKIQRADDLLSDLDHINKENQLQLILSYIVTFPLMMASSVKVFHPQGSFKPEYIIPQLLLQFISKRDDIDGIKFLSTKVDYSKLDGVGAYNYIFPVKQSKSEGLCDSLTELFNVTEPTSLKLEELRYNVKDWINLPDEFLDDTKGYLELIKEERDNYKTTSFGRLEKSLESLSTKKI